MKKHLLTLVSIAILAGCATAPLVVGTALQIASCELAKARPAAAAPLLAAGLTFQAYADTDAPTRVQLAAALSSIPALAGVDAVEVRAFVDLVLAGYEPLYASVETEADKARLRTWFAQVGGAFVSGSHCQPVAPQPAGALGRPNNKPAPTWIDLAEGVRGSMKQVKK